MIKHARSLNLLRVAWIFTCTAIAVSTARADVIQIAVDTSSLAGNASGPFSLDFQLNDGSGNLAGPNTATLSNFVFTGRGPTGSATLSGGVTGSLSSSVTLNDSANVFNEFYQGFSAGTTRISFTANLTTNIDPGLTPDAFSIAILNSSLANIRTNDPSNGDTLLLLNIDKRVLAGSDLQTFTSTSPAGVTVSAASVPEPNSFGLLLTMFVVSLGSHLYRLRKA